MKYEIERKAPGESVYTKVGELNPQAGLVLANRSYQFDNDLTGGSSGNFSYRIRQIIDTAVASFYAVYIDTTNISVSSCVVTGNPNPQPVGEFLLLQPNPASGSTVTLVIETPYIISNMPVIIHDGKGRMMKQWNDSKTVGRKTIDIDISRFASGKYYINVFNGQKSIGTVELMKL
jgi:hypothetical protein